MPWKGPGIYPAGPGQKRRKPPPERFDDQEADGEPGTERRTGRGARAAATRARKSRNRLILGGAAVVVVAALTVLGMLRDLPFQGSAAKAPSDGFVTTYQRGDFRSVPDSCTAMSATILSQYLPGKVAEVSPPLGSGAESQCTWTLDTRPQFRVLTVTTQAFAPSLLSTGNGSATAGAKDAYDNQLQQLRDPPKSSKAPPAQIGGTVGLGNAGFTATQVFNLAGEVSDKVTVVSRERNVVIVVTMQGQESGGGFGPVPNATLLAGALAAAHDEIAALH